MKLAMGRLKTRKLGVMQLSVLRSMIDHRRWHDGCGWYWGSRYETQLILTGLVKRGLVDFHPAKAGKVAAYTINEAGKKAYQLSRET